MDASGDPSAPLPLPELPLNDAAITFVPRSPLTEDGRVPIDMLMTMNYDIQPLLNRFQAEATQALTDNGCSHQNVHSFSYTPQADALLIRFHVKYVKRSCWWFFGEQTTDIATVEANAWTKLSFVASPDHHHVNLVSQSGGDDNVQPLLRDIMKIIANLASILPGTNAIGLHLDSQMFQMLKVERDFLDGSLASSYFQDSSFIKKADIGKTRLGKTVKVDLVFAQSQFLQRDGHTLLSVVISTSQDHPLAESQICAMRAILEQQKHQEEKLGRQGAKYQIVAGDSLWKISTAYYGGPAYRWLIADANGITEDHMSALHTGQTLNLPTFASYMYAHNLHMTEDNDSLWKISRVSGSVPFQRLKVGNSQISNPDLIYQGQVIHTNF